MQTRTTKLAIGTFALALLSLTSCKKDEVQTTLTASNSPTLTASATTAALTQATGTQTAVTFTWTPVKSLAFSDASTTATPAITYYLQFDKKGHNFGAPVSIAAGSVSTTATSTTTAVTVSDLNTALTSLGLTVGTATDVEVRLNASYASNSSTYSNTLPLKATTYECKQPSLDKAWSLIGTVGPGTDWSTDYVMTFDCSTNNYTYTGALKVGVYKFRYGGNVGNWNANLGGTSSTGGALTQDGGNLSITTAGTYTVTLIPAALDPTTGKVTAGSSYTIK
ncbi:MAG: SusF/SusE family outer membrane protein [Hymenobacter sp.]|nr:MAG: SusF/SusE family outer membrane protein [Hymenobacter sp.]